MCLFVCFGNESYEVTIATVECREGVQEVFVSDVRTAYTIEFVEKAIEEVAAHEIPEVVEVVVRHLGNALIYDVSPDMLTKVAATREPFHCIEEVVMVEREGYHIYYLLLIILYLLFAGGVGCVIEVFVAFVVDALCVTVVNALVFVAIFISEINENVWNPNLVVFVTNEHTVEWLEGMFGFRNVEFEGFGVETSSVVGFGGGEELRTLIVGGFTEVESVEQSVELDAPDILLIVVLDCCTEFSVILRIPSFEDCRDA